LCLLQPRPHAVNSHLVRNPMVRLADFIHRTIPHPQGQCPQHGRFRGPDASATGWRQCILGRDSESVRHG